MFRSRDRRPAATAFQHGDRCATPDATPQWDRVAEGHWQRVCSCRVENAYPVASRPPAPDASTFVHGADEAGGPCRSTAVVSWSEDDGAWRIFCGGCSRTDVVWPFQRGVDELGEPVPLPVGTAFVPAGVAS